MNNIDRDFIKNAKSQNPDKLLETLSAEDRNKVEEALANKETLEKLLKSPQAIEIMKLLYGKGKNG